MTQENPMPVRPVRQTRRPRCRTTDLFTLAVKNLGRGQAVVWFRATQCGGGTVLVWELDPILSDVKLGTKDRGEWRWVTPFQWPLKERSSIRLSIDSMDVLELLDVSPDHPPKAFDKGTAVELRHTVDDDTVRFFARWECLW